MAHEKSVHVPEEFFEREEISIEDIREIVPGGSSLKPGRLLQTFSKICQTKTRTRLNWKTLCIKGNGKAWGRDFEGLLGFTDMIQSGLLKNTEQLTFGDFWDFGDNEVLALAESLRSGQLSLRHLNLHLIKPFGILGAAALSSWLESNQAVTLESLSINGYLWSHQGLSLLFKSFKKGAVQSLMELELRCHGFDNDNSELALIAELTESLEAGQINTLRRLTLCSKRGYGIYALASLARCSQLRRLEYLNLGVQGEPQLQSPLQPRGREADYWYARAKQVAIEDRKAAFQVNNLENLEVLTIYGDIGDDVGEIFFSSLQAGLRILDLDQPGMSSKKFEAMATWLRSGNASNLVELRVKDQHSSQYMTLIVIVCFSGEFENLQIINVTTSRIETETILELVQALERGKLPLLRECIFIDESCFEETTVQRAVLNAYTRNKSLTVSLWEDNPKSLNDDEFRRRIRDYQLSNQQQKQTLVGLEKEPGTYGKIFLCGSPGVGKTTLRRTLQKTWKSRFSTSRQHEATRGIEVDHLRFAGDNSSTQKVELALWDLAGQSEYEVLHSTFLPDIALGDGQATFFVVVCSANASRESNVNTARDALLYWLRFISSNSPKRMDKELRRRVLVVLNCFHGQQAGHDLEEWKGILIDWRKQFQDFLDLHPEPFSLDAKKKSQTRKLKEHLYMQAQTVLQRTQVPKICHNILRNCLDWVAEEANQNYPVLSWNRYREAVVRTKWSHETVKAATVYLHETGHIILFRRLQRSGASSSREYDFTEQAILVLNPEWLCERVIGHLLLPKHLLRHGEESLSTYRNRDNSIRLALIQRDRLQIPEEKGEEMVRILIRLGLGYSISSDYENIFIPALIREDSVPTWFTEAHQTLTLGTPHSWVIGFSLTSKDSWRTLLPAAVLRKLQVNLAEDDRIGRRTDSAFTAAISRIWFKWEGLGFLVEYHGDPLKSQLNRLDILVKPLVENDCVSENQARLQRRRQVKLAQIIVDKALDVASDCPGLELERSVVHPWVGNYGLVPLQDRDVSFSVEAMIGELRKTIENSIDAEQENDLWTTNWTVGGELVKYEDVLGEDEWRNTGGIFEKRCELTELALERLHILEPPPLLQSEGDLVGEVHFENEESHNGMLAQEDATSKTDIILRRLWSEVRAGRKEAQQGFKQMHHRFDNIDARLHKVLKFQHTLNRSVQFLETFTLSEKNSSVPRFVYLTTNEGSGGAWKRIKDVFRQEVFLHFLCEAGLDKANLHEVEGQLGVRVTDLQDWAKKFAPILNWSLRIAFVAAKVAGNAVLPGLGLMLPDISNDMINSLSTMTNGISEFLRFCSDTEGQNLGEWNMNAVGEKEVRGTARAELKRLLGEFSPYDFVLKVSLRKVTILDSSRSTGEVIWICNRCFTSYGSRVRELD